MKNGTLSEKRTKVDHVALERNQPVLKTMISPEGVAKNNPSKEPVSVEKPEPVTITAQPQVQVEPKPKHISDTKCMYCKAEAITTLAIRGGIVLVLFALCFNLIKSAKK